MRQGITVQVSEGDRVRLAAIVVDRNSPQKHVWRARIVLMTADGVGTTTIMRQTGKSKVTVWRWRGRAAAAERKLPSASPVLPARIGYWSQREVELRRNRSDDLGRRE